MSKVHPSAISSVKSEEAAAAAGSGGGTTVLTVWRKSLLFNCEGFTVFDFKGNLVFRVDHYGAGRRGEVVLMDADGTPLLTIRRKRLSLGEQWLVYEGDEASCAAAGHPLLSVKKHVSLLRHRAALAHVAGGGGSGEKRRRTFDVEGSYSQRSVAVYDDRRRRLAEVQKKEAAGGVGLGADVFRLVVEPGFDATVAMAVVVVLEQMFPSRE